MMPSTTFVCRFCCTDSSYTLQFDAAEDALDRGLAAFRLVHRAARIVLYLAAAAAGLLSIYRQAAASCLPRFAVACRSRAQATCNIENILTCACAGIALAATAIVAKVGCCCSLLVGPALLYDPQLLDAAMGAAVPAVYCSFMWRRNVVWRGVPTSDILNHSTLRVQHCFRGICQAAAQHCCQQQYCRTNHSSGSLQCLVHACTEVEHHLFWLAVSCTKQHFHRQQKRYIQERLLKMMNFQPHTRPARTY